MSPKTAEKRKKKNSGGMAPSLAPHLNLPIFKLIKLIRLFSYRKVELLLRELGNRKSTNEI